MADDKGPSNDLAVGVRSIFERIGEFFHIFDLSFLVGGVSSFGALAFLALMMKKPLEFPFPTWVSVSAVIVACYVCGLIAFTAGRELSRLTYRKSTLEDTLPKALEAHGLEEESIRAYTTANPPRLWYLYVRMWSEIAHDRTAPLVLQHLMRYWAMAATYDAVAVSFLLWAGVLFSVQFEAVATQPLGSWHAFTGVAACLASAWLALRRGATYYRYQIEDVVAHFAVSRGPLTKRELT